MSGVGLGASYFLLVNGAAFLLFYIDKRRARTDKRRISERTLLLSAVLGGSVGAKLGQQSLRHKTVKWPFGLWLNLIIAAQIIGIAVWFIPGLREGLIALLAEVG